MTTITIDRALLEQALEALEIVADYYDDDSAVGLEIDAIQALRAELAKPTAKGSNSCAVGILTEFTRQCADPGAICLLAQLLGVGPCPDCDYIKSHCKCVKPSAVETITTPAWHDAPEVLALKAERDELLAAVKAMYSEACSTHQKWLQIMNTASAAIAKAEGAP